MEGNSKGKGWKGKEQDEANGKGKDRAAIIAERREEFRRVNENAMKQFMKPKGVGKKEGKEENKKGKGKEERTQKRKGRE